MNQPAAKLDLRTQMPLTAEWVEKKRLEWGKDHVNRCIRDALAGVPGRFYAIEAGHVLGTPFPANHPAAEWQQYAVVNSTAFAGFIAEPGAA